MRLINIGGYKGLGGFQPTFLLEIRDEVEGIWLATEVVSALEYKCAYKIVFVDDVVTLSWLICASIRGRLLS